PKLARRGEGPATSGTASDRALSGGATYHRTRPPATGAPPMKRILPVEELARDERFVRIKIEDVVFDPRNAVRAEAPRNQLRPSAAEAPDAARALMHGIFVGEIQALEGAGRTCWDFDTGPGRDE